MREVKVDNIKVKKDPETNEFYLDMADLNHYFDDSSLVASYELVELDTGALSIKFYDKEGNHLKLKNLDKKE
jgi:hypothetical protein